MDDGPLITVSAIKAFAACPRLYLHAYVRGVRELVPAKQLRFGTLFHRSVEQYWRTRAGADRDPSAAAMAVFDAERWKLDAAYDEAALEALLLAYCAVWSTRQVEVLGVELQFRFALPGSGWHVGGKIDLLLRLPDGRVMLVEHKTSGRDASPGSQYMARLAIDAQLDIYYAGVRALGHAPAGVLYDVVRKPALQPLARTAAPRFRRDGKPYAGVRLDDETPEEYGERVRGDVAANLTGYVRLLELGRTEQQAAAAARDVRGWARAIDAATAAGDWPRNTDACFRYGTPCPFFGVCTGTASLDDPRAFRVVGAHAELADDTDDAEQERDA